MVEGIRVSDAISDDISDGIVDPDIGSLVPRIGYPPFPREMRSIAFFLL